MKDIEDKVLNFWFKELTPKNWFEKNIELDRKITKEFGDLHSKAHSGELSELRKTTLGRLSEIIILDQFSRNIYRDDPRSFESDPLALSLAQETISLDLDKELDLTKRSFLYMPYMHSECLLVHNVALELFSLKGLESNLDFEKKHRDIIVKFGRYPHRNKVLGRESTPEEVDFLNLPGSSF
jgi:uncharacterized protein (DUF924 family)